MKRTCVAIYQDLTGKKTAMRAGEIEGVGTETPPEKVTETTKAME